MVPAFSSRLMALLLFRLRNVPDDEAEDIRQLLTSNRVDYYETDAGNWGISMPALWLGDDSDAERAKKLIDDYQLERASSARQLHDRRGILDSFRERPLKSFLYLAFGCAVLYFSIKPFLNLLPTG